MNRLPPDSITAKVRRIFGRGMLEGVRVAGIPNPEEFLMNQKRMRSVVAGLNGVATKVLSAVPLAEDWTLNQIAAELHRQDKGYTLDVVEGSLAKLLEVGLVKVHGLGKGRTFRSLYSMVQHEAEEKAAVRLDQQRAQERPVPPVPGATPQPVAAPARPIDPLTLLSDLAEDARKIGHGLQVLADRLDNVALAVAAKIEDAGTADQKLQQMRQQFKALLGEDA